MKLRDSGGRKDKPEGGRLKLVTKRLVMGKVNSLKTDTYFRYSQIYMIYLQNIVSNHFFKKNSAVLLLYLYGRGRRGAWWAATASLRSL